MNISLILSAIFVPVFVMVAISAMNKSKIATQKKMTKNNFIVKIPIIVFALGLMLDICCLAIVLCFTFFAQKLPNFIFYMVFGFGVWIGTFLMLKTLIFKVIVHDQIITVQDFLRKPFEFSFSEITSVLRQTKNNYAKSERMIIEFNSGKKLIVESTEISYKTFLNRIKEEVNDEFLFGFE